MVTVKVICVNGWKMRTKVFKDIDEANAFIDEMQEHKGYKCYKDIYVGW